MNFSDRLFPRSVQMAAVVLAIVAICIFGSASSEPEKTSAAESYQPPKVQQLVAAETLRISAPEARQGAAVDAEHCYAIGNSVIAKYDRRSFEKLNEWRGPRGGLIGHLNSCFVSDGLLWCANSNHPRLPFANSVEVFDAETFKHERSVPLGIMDEGSLVWFDAVEEGWIVGLAQYNDETGLSFKDNSFAGVFLFDSEWRRTGGWALPSEIVERMAPQAASGGAIGPDGFLYLMGHDRPEMYVLARPQMGPYLLHIATIAIDAEGQAFDFDESRPGEVCAISRPAREIGCFRLPTIGVPESAGRFRQ